MSAPRSLLDKIWTEHVVDDRPGRPTLLYVDLHLIHEVTSPQAFAGLRQAGRRVRRPDLTFATVDHAVPTSGRDRPWADASAVAQVDALRGNCREAEIPLIDVDDDRQGIVHVLAPEQGLSQPGMTIVCGDSHTSTHGAFGALAFGIGTSEVEHVLATQTVLLERPHNLAVEVEGELPHGVTAKDLALAIIHAIGTAGARRCVIEYRGPTVKAMDMEARMTLCNMAIEAGARAGLVEPDETTFEYLRGRRFAPAGAAWEQAVASWRKLATDAGAHFDHVVRIEAAHVEPRVTWGTNPAQSVGVDSTIPELDAIDDAAERELARQALAYMGLEPGTAMTDITVDRVFIGSCTNARIADLRAAAAIVDGRRVARSVHAMVVPGSGAVKAEAEAEGLDFVFRDAGFEWREPGCSMCLGMNPDVLEPGQRCASTSNRNFEGRQGPRGRTHLVSPEMAAAAAIAGHFVDVRDGLR